MNDVAVADLITRCLQEEDLHVEVDAEDRVWWVTFDFDGRAKEAMLLHPPDDALAERSAETLRVDDFEALLAAVRKLQPRTIVGVQGEYGGQKKIAEGRFIRVAETGPIAASWSRRAIVEEVVPGWQVTGAPRQLDVSPQELRAVQKTRFKRR